MRCPIETQESAELLLAYSHRKLDAETAAILEQHINGCPACREIADGQRAVWEAMDRWEAPPVSADFDRRLYRRIEEEVSFWDRMLRPFRPFLVRQGLPVAAAATLLIVAGLLVERPANVPPRVPVSAQVDVVAPEQADHALQEMEMMREFNRLIHPDAAEPKM
jgi:anti-sigma factor RsiW